MKINPKKPSQAEIESIRRGGTEPPFKNAYWNHHEDGIYVDSITGKPLFSSTKKFDSGTGWPSFSEPLEPQNIQTQEDHSLGIERTEVHSSGGHLGHVFNDGPKNLGGKRYCINSATLTFIPAQALEKEGYPQYAYLFQKGDLKSAVRHEQLFLTKWAKQQQLKASNKKETYPDPTEIALFSAGCYWGIEEQFREIQGVVATAVGFSGGHQDNPHYDEVCSGSTGHAETVAVEYDPKKVQFGYLLKLFWEIHDPSTKNRQGPDVGTQYRSMIHYTNDTQKKLALASLEQIKKSPDFKNATIYTEIVPAGNFWTSHQEHQQWVEKGNKAFCNRRHPK